VRLFLFGRFRLTFDGEPRKLAALPRSLALLALVAARGAQPMQREALAYALWPDDDERDARANLRRHIHSVRRALPPECDPFVVDDTHIAWNPASLMWCDVVAFERERAARRFDAAIDAYGGPLLDESLDEPLVAERERLQNVFVTLGIERIRSARAAGELERAIDVAQRVASADPWREDVVRALIELRHESGDRAGALETYDRFARRLESEMGVAPMPETTALRARVAANAARAESPARVNPARIELAFVERERELDELAALLAFDDPQRPAAAFVVGEAGIGKSRVLAEFAHRAEARGVRVASGGVPAVGERTPYLALVSALQPFARVLQHDLDPPRAALVGTLLDPAGDHRERSRLLVFDAIAAAFESIAREGPLLVVCDDAHWAGEATVAALAFLARRLARSPIALAIAFRSEAVGHQDPIGRAARELIDDGAAFAVPIGPLSASGMCAAIGDALADDALVAELSAVAEGNPFFLGEALRDRLEGARVGSRGSVDDVIDARLERLDDRARTFLEIAAVAGDAFSLDVVRAAGGMSEADARVAIDDVLDRQIVRDGGRRLGYRFAFAHHLIRARIYESMPPDVRDRRHLRIASVLERRASNATSDVAADLAHHFDRGGDHERAAAYSLAAARNFARVGAFDEAAAHADRGVALARDPELRFDLLLARERVAEARGDRERQVETLEAAASLATELGDARRSFDLLVRRTVSLRARGRRDEELRATERLIALAESLHDPECDALALLQRAKTSATLGAGDPRPDLARAIRLLDAAGDPRARIEARCDAVRILTALRRPFEQAEHLEAARRIVEDARDTDGEIMVLEASVAAQLLPAPHAAIADGERLIPILVARGERERLAELYQRLATCTARVGRASVALDYCARARRLYLDLQKFHGLGAVANAIGTAHMALGHPREALAEFDAAYETFVRFGDVRGRAIARTNRSYACLTFGDFALGRRAAEHALALARECGIDALVSVAASNLGANLLWHGEIDLALESLEASLEGSGIGRAADRVDDLAHYVVALVRAGRTAEALAIARELRDARSSSGESHAFDHFAAYAVSLAESAAGDARAAHAALEDARVSLARYYAALDPAADRDALARYTETAAVESALREAGLALGDTQA
jgi:DNA-binding SARP family transcriptional activator